MSSGPIGFIGLGSMGAPIARRLLDSGRDLVVFDVSKDKLDEYAVLGAQIAASPADVASRAELVMVSLPTPDVVRQVALGPEGIIAGDKVRIYVDLSTTGPKAAQEVGAALATRNIVAIDSPVSGGVGGAIAGTLALMVSGNPDVVKQVIPALSEFGKPGIVGTEVGQGHSLKLTNNLLSATHLAITAEAMVLGVKAGLDPDVMLAIINTGSGRNAATEERFPNHVLNRSFNNGFANALMRKDVRLCLDMAETLQVPLWVGTAVDRLWMQTVLQVGASQNSTTIVQTLEQWTGVEVRGKDAPATTA
ncbi:NAD(P)-dependent oxidoreductase [Bordetella holmesii]|uniref:NAD-binding of NADP-dependent 3-hydroxyisobutyrate dehydrogenase n=3 Tax=Bordetella holmesii TaxID=35814 RepID=A0A158M8E0_9BORD|nr:NAD(P)-dependent oxidoreductase [Bordetella holmesii]AMD47149.1 oxidoreductase [Bordetella holmesii H558]AMD47482.1 oxidoreductase [Bordetella holmesii F627]AOB36050.1 oxidoreductase [Bordetella holmesii]AUL20021.1 oxidoreductase [Bordetella holmesii]AUL23358.1 oxidoreductase [Bordetella holmesii]